MTPCKRGHTEGRGKNRCCVVCAKARNNTPERKAYMKAYYYTHRAEAARARRRYGDTAAGILVEFTSQIKSEAKRRGNR